MAQFVWHFSTSFHRLLLYYNIKFMEMQMGKTNTLPGKTIPIRYRLKPTVFHAYFMEALDFTKNFVYNDI